MHQLKISPVLFVLNCIKLCVYQVGIQNSKVFKAGLHHLHTHTPLGFNCHCC